MEVSELKEFDMYNAYATDMSYIKALFKESKICTVNEVGCITSLANIINGFNNRKIGKFQPWSYLPKGSNYAFLEMIEYNDFNYLNKKLKENGSLEYSIKNCYTITINKDYSINIKTYVNINLTSDVIQWIDSEQAKLMICRKITVINKNGGYLV